MKTPSVDLSKYFLQYKPGGKPVKIPAKEMEAFNEACRKIRQEFMYRAQKSRELASGFIFNA